MSKRAVVFSLITWIILSGIACGAQIPVTDCQKLSGPGTYVLQNDIINSDAIVCINITSSDVIFQGNGHTVDGQDKPSSWGIFATSPAFTNIVVQDVIVNDWVTGISLRNTRDSAVLASSATSNRFGILPGYYNSTITNCRAVKNSQTGIYAWSNNNITIIGNIINENQYQGLYLGFSKNCTVRDNRLEGNNLGFFIVESDNNQIFNNYFNNTANVIFGTNVLDNQWNTTTRPGMNIAGGPYLAGNFWANPKGDGFSQICPDGNNDGVCDSAFSLDAKNIDQLPLSNKFLRPLPGYSDIPTDPDSDGLYEDLNANARKDFNDVVVMFNQMQWIAAHEPISAFDFNGNGRIDFNDIVKLFGEI